MRKIAEVLGWLVIGFTLLGVFNVGIFRFSYQWEAFGQLQFQTSQLSIPNEVKKFYHKINKAK